MNNPALLGLVKIGQLKAEPTSSREIRNFLNHAAQSLKDAAVPGLSASGRFGLSYEAAHALALAALRANDVRPNTGAGHRAIVFQSLVHTIGAPDEFGSALNRYHTKRNKSEYVDWIEATEAEAGDLFDLASQLEGRVMKWLKANRRELLA